MVAAYGDAVAVAHDHDDLELRLERLDPGCIGKRAAVGGVQGIGDEIVVGLAGAADAGDDDGVGVGVAQFLEGAQQRAQHAADAAPRAPHVRHDTRFEVLDSRCVRHG